MPNIRPSWAVAYGVHSIPAPKIVFVRFTVDENTEAPELWSVFFTSSSDVVHCSASFSLLNSCSGISAKLSTGTATIVSFVVEGEEGKSAILVLC